MRSSARRITDCSRSTCSSPSGRRRRRATRDRYRATFYDYTNGRALHAEGKLGDAAPAAVSVSARQPRPTAEEFDAAVAILRRHKELGPGLRSGALQPYRPMPPLVDEQAARRARRAHDRGRAPAHRSAQERPRDRRREHDPPPRGAVRGRRADDGARGSRPLRCPGRRRPADHRPGRRRPGLGHRLPGRHAALAVPRRAPVRLVRHRRLGGRAALRRLPGQAGALPGARPDPERPLRQEPLRAVPRLAVPGGDDPGDRARTSPRVPALPDAGEDDHRDRARTPGTSSAPRSTWTARRSSSSASSRRAGTAT